MGSKWDQFAASEDTIGMAGDLVERRLLRIYAALDEAAEGDLSKFPPTVIDDEQMFGIHQDFLGGLSPSQIENLAHSVIHNIANLRDHLRRWAKQNGLDIKEVDRTVDASRPLQLIEDLSNNDKHGYPPRDRGRSGIAPQLQEVNRVLKMTTGETAGSFVAMTLSPAGPVISSSGGGGATVVITGTIVDADDVVLGDLYAVELEAVEAWEELHSRLTDSIAERSSD